MKHVISALCISAYILASLLSQTFAAEWEYYSLSNNSNPLFYDTSSMLKNGHIVKVYQKEFYSTNVLYWLRQRLGEKYIDLQEAVSHIAIDCSKAEYNLVAFTHYTSKGEVIKSQNYEGKMDWKTVDDSPDMRILYEICCFHEWHSIAASEAHDYFLNIGTVQVNNSNANVTFWMKEVDRKTGKETEKEKVTIVCEKDKYTLRHLIKYDPDGSVKEVLTDNDLRRWIRIKSNTIIEGIHDVLCDEKYVRQNVKDYLKSVSK